MGKQTKPKKAENLGKGKVTPVQIAFIVDRYLCDNNYAETRSVFRNEASSLIAKSPIREAPKSLLSLAEILDEYICLKEQKVILDQEKVRVEQEKTRVQNLLKGMQSVMNIYNTGGNPNPNPTSIAPKLMIMAPQEHLSTGSPAAGLPMYQTPIPHPVSTPSNTNMGPGNSCSPITVDPPAATNKRKDSRFSLDAPNTSKRSRSRLPAEAPNKGVETDLASDNAPNYQESAQPSSAVQSSLHNLVPNGSLGNGSTVAKCLFNQPSPSVPNNSSGLRTPTQANSSQSDKSASPFEISSTATCSNNNSPPEIAPNCCTIFSSKRVTLSPNKACYTVETNHCISSPSPAKTSRRDHVKGRLNFDCSDVPMALENPISDEISTSESEKEVGLFDIDLPNFDAIGVDFSFTELLGDFDRHCEELGIPCQPNVGASTGTVSGSSYDSADGNVGANQIMSEFSSTVTEVLSDKGTNVQGSDSMTAMKSVTKCIRIISPVKKSGSSLA